MGIVSTKEDKPKDIPEKIYNSFHNPYTEKKMLYESPHPNITSFDEIIGPEPTINIKFVCEEGNGKYVEEYRAINHICNKYCNCANKSGGMINREKYTGITSSTSNDNQYDPTSSTSDEFGRKISKSKLNSFFNNQPKKWVTQAGTEAPSKWTTQAGGAKETSLTSPMETDSESIPMKKKKKSNILDITETETDDSDTDSNFIDNDNDNDLDAGDDIDVEDVEDLDDIDDEDIEEGGMYVNSDFSLSDMIKMKDNIFNSDVEDNNNDFNADANTENDGYTSEMRRVMNKMYSRNKKNQMSNNKIFDEEDREILGMDSESDSNSYMKKPLKRNAKYQ